MDCERILGDHDDMFCPRCRLEQTRDHFYCPRCGAVLPRHLLEDRPAKATRLFAAMKVDPSDPDAAFLRVSCYRRDQTIATPEGSVTLMGHHVRISVWVGDAAVCALSLPEGEGQELSEFLAEELGRVGDPEIPA